MKKNLEIFKKWIEYLASISTVEECGYELRDTENEIFNSKKHYHHPHSLKVLMARRVNNLECIYNNLYNANITPWKIFRRKMIIKEIC